MKTSKVFLSFSMLKLFAVVISNDIAPKCADVDSIPYETLSTDGRYEHSFIFYAAANTATFYLNGRVIGVADNKELFYFTPVNLTKNDVIAVKASRKVNNGIIAAFFFDKKMIKTGDDEWYAWTPDRRDASGSEDNSWMQPDFNVCDQAKAHLAKGRENEWRTGMSMYFPYYTGARYIWSTDASNEKYVYFRYKIGGEECENSPDVPVTIRYAASDEISLYINGGLSGYEYNFPKYQTARPNKLRIGDVFSIEAMARKAWNGVSVAIERGPSNITTGDSNGDTNWKITTDDQLTENWKYKNYQPSCHWLSVEPVNPDGQTVPKPDPSNAEYVWTTRETRPGKKVYIRAVIGGDENECS